MRGYYWWTILGLSWAIVFLTAASYAADLPIPKPQPYQQCVRPGNKPAPGQVIMPDRTCQSGFRWTNPTRQE